MLHIVSDSSCMIHPDDAKDLNLHILPFELICDGVSKKDYLEITPEEVVELCAQGCNVTSSQPSIGAKLDTYNTLLENPEDEILDICMADGLSGAYQNSLMAREMSEDPSRIHIFNSRTLCGPHKSMVLEALWLREAGYTRDEIIETMLKMRDHEKSLLAVSDFSYLAKGGRIPAAAGKIGSMLNIVTLVQKAEDGKKLELCKTSRTMKKALKTAVEKLIEIHPNAAYQFYVCHAGALEDANLCASMIEEAIPNAAIDVLPLCSVFTAHGGPGCISIHAIAVPEVVRHSTAVLADRQPVWIYD